MVPQDGYLFDATLADNIRYGRPGATDEDIRLALTELGLADWLEGLPDGLRSGVGQRGESLSAGERQLVALARAYLAAPDLLVLDEATSAVDPATEVRIARALEGITRGRTAISIAHRPIHRGGRRRGDRLRPGTHRSAGVRTRSWWNSRAVTRICTRRGRLSSGLDRSAKTFAMYWPSRVNGQSDRRDRKVTSFARGSVREH